jgi:thymidylate synthase (FAD)
MQVIKPSFEIMDTIDAEKMLRNIERYARTCYQSEPKSDSFEDTKIFLKKLLYEKKHDSVFEHEKITVKFICDRGVSHEIVRHRIASYSQESTRYCNYANDKFGNEITVIEPCFWHNMQSDGDKYTAWLQAMKNAEDSYFALINMGALPQEARSVLPNSLKTEIVCTFNIREWRHFFRLRTAISAHPQMREITIPLYNEFKKQIPILFDDI